MRDADIIRVLTTAFPEFQVDSYSQDLPTIVYGDFAIYIRSKTLHDGPNDPQVRRAFDFINTVFASVPADNDLINTIPIGELAAELDSDRFVRIHRSYLLSIERLEKVELYAKDSRVAMLRDGARLPVSRAGYARLKELL